MGVGTRWWRRVESEEDNDAWGGPDDVTVAPDPRTSIEDDGREEREAEAREAAEREARETAEREARETAERQARETAERQAREHAERQAREHAEREARETAERQAREQAEREAREAAEREAREQAEREAREAAERQAREQAEREARERQAREREARETAEREAREKAERERREREETAAQDLVSTLPGAETVPPPLARDAAAREAAARAASKANRKRRRRRVFAIFLIAALAVGAVWIIPRLIALALALVSALGVGPAPEPPPIIAAAPVAAVAGPPAELPRGGSTILPAQRVVALREAPGSGPSEASADRLDAVAVPFGTSDREVLPALELPVRDVADAPGAWQRLALTRAHRQLLVLAVPTGPTAVRAALEPWERLLREPDVGLALDSPALAPEELGAVTAWLADVVRTGNLPQKLVVVPGTANGAPSELAVVATDGAQASAPRGVVLPPGGPSPTELLAADPAPDVVLYR
jgi:chemotaxis protein histidine kinase CheA